MSESIQEKVVELLNEASINNKDIVRVNNLKQVQEIILYREPSLLDNFLEEMLQFQFDKSCEVKKCILNFIEEAIKKDPEIIAKVIDNLRYLLYDDNINVQKRGFLSMINIYKSTYKWLVKLKTMNNSITEMWECLQEIKNHIISQLDSDNDGIRTTSIKFIEMVVVLLTGNGKEYFNLATNTEYQNQDFVDQIPEDHKILKRSILYQECRILMEKIVNFTLSPHISSVNLIASLSVLGNICRQRPEYIPRVLQVIATLQANFPPSLGKSQVSSVKKQLKMQLLSILKQPNSIDHQHQIGSLLIELGLNPNEVSKHMPKNTNESRKRSVLSHEENFSAKKLKNMESFPINEVSTKFSVSKENSTFDHLIDAIIIDLVDKLSIQENVTDLVLLTMNMLPDSMPTNFPNSYKPIAAAGTLVQIKELARLLALQFKDAGLCNELQQTIKNVIKLNEKFHQEQHTLNDESKKTVLAHLQQSHMNATKKVSKTYRLSDVSGELSRSALEKLLRNSYDRILQFEAVSDVEMTNLHAQFLINITRTIQFEEDAKNFMFANLRKRLSFGLLWIHDAYFKWKNPENYSRTEKHIQKSYQQYERIQYNTLNSVQLLYPRDLLFSRLISEIPYLTENSLTLLKEFCEDSTRSYVGITTIRDLILRRPNKKQQLLSLILILTFNKIFEIRNNAIQMSKRLHEHENFRKDIEKSHRPYLALTIGKISKNDFLKTGKCIIQLKIFLVSKEYALNQLKYLVSPVPPNLIELHNSTNEWNEENIKLCLFLYLELMPLNHFLIHPLSKIYGGAIPEVKRVILRMIEQSIKEMGMHSAELLKLIEDCPKGSETLVTRIIYILTDKIQPSSVLVEKVRDLHAKRVSDVRLLIPVLNCLTKVEIVAVLPQLIKLSDTVVKEVFNRLLSENSPIKPAELIIALHEIDSTNLDLKPVMNATSLCLGEKQIYSQDVLMSVLQELSEIDPIPTIFMRTVMQTLNLYPKISNFIIGIMNRLINKQVWKYSKVWEGFIKCCQRIKPMSSHILLQLPPGPLRDVLSKAPDLKEVMQKYVRTTLRNQKIPESILSIIEESNDGNKSIDINEAKIDDVK